MYGARRMCQTDACRVAKNRATACLTPMRPWILASLLVATPAWAQENAADVGTARSLGTEGLRLAESGNCAAAVEKLSRAEKLHHAPTTLERLGECEITLGRIVEGTEDLRRVTLEHIPPHSPAVFVTAQARARTALERRAPPHRQGAHRRRRARRRRRVAQGRRCVGVERDHRRRTAVRSRRAHDRSDSRGLPSELDASSDRRGWLAGGDPHARARAGAEGRSTAGTSSRHDRGTTSPRGSLSPSPVARRSQEPSSVASPS